MIKICGVALLAVCCQSEIRALELSERTLQGCNNVITFPSVPSSTVDTRNDKHRCTLCDCATRMAGVSVFIGVFLAGIRELYVRYCSYSSDNI